MVNRLVCRIIFWLFLLTLLGGCSKEDVKEDEDIESIKPALKSDFLILESSIDVPRRSEGDLILLNDGNLLLVYTKFIGGYDDHSKAILVKRASANNRTTWSDEIEFIKGEGGLNVMSASLLRLKNGKIALFYLVKNSTKDCFPVVRFSSDEGNTWSSPIACVKPGKGYNIMNNGRAVQLSTGRIILPVSSHTLSPEGNVQPRGEISCYYSDDSGLTWLQGDILNETSSIILQEPGVVELLNGRLLMYIRTNQEAQFFSYSGDNGRTWGPISKSTITSPLSPASIVRNPYTGNLIAVWNNSKTERMPLCMAISMNEGGTWKNKVYLENKENYWACYSAVEFTSSNDIYVMYSISKKEQWGLGSLKLIHVKYK